MGMSLCECTFMDSLIIQNFFLLNYYEALLRTEFGVPETSKVVNKL